MTVVAVKVEAVTVVVAMVEAATVVVVKVEAVTVVVAMVEVVTAARLANRWHQTAKMRTARRTARWQRPSFERSRIGPQSSMQRIELLGAWARL